jgi:hypothetical protein
MLNCNRESYMVTSAAENGARRKPRPPPPIPPMNEDGHVLKSRRGLLAAGLAVVVVGALGVASTLNAGAEQVPGDQDTAQAPVAQQADATDSADDVSTPPATLPWGGKPQRAHRGRAGLTSRQLKAQGFQSAPDSDGTHLDFAPKGRSNRTTFLKSEVTSVQPPAPAASGSASTTTPATTSPATTSPATTPATTSATTSATTAPPASASPAQALAATTDPAANTSPAPSGSASKDPSTRKVNFLYSVGSEAQTADGVYVAMDVRKPTLAKGDYHTLAELALQSADTQQTIEVGWNIDRSVNGDDDPHLFVFHWVNNQPTCYNVCGGFVPYKGGVAPGDTLPVGNLKMFGIQHVNGAWWIAYDNTLVGYFPDKEWTSQGVDFTQGGYFQAFGEVASSSPNSCSGMGSNAPASDTVNAARMGQFTYVNNPATANLYMRSTSDTYGMNPVKGSTRAFWYGGQGTNC